MKSEIDTTFLCFCTKTCWHVHCIWREIACIFVLFTK